MPLNFIWINAKTGQRYDDYFSPAEFIDQEILNDTIVRGKLLRLTKDEPELVELRRIIVPKLSEPLILNTSSEDENVWVLYKTGIIFNASIYEKDIQGAFYDLKTDKLIQLNLLSANYHPQLQTVTPLFTIELIPKLLQQHRIKRVWVIANTGILADDMSHYKPSILQNPLYDSQGFLIHCSRIINNKIISYEFIPSTLQKHRSRVWVYQGTEIAIASNFNWSTIKEIQYDQEEIPSIAIPHDTNGHNLEFIEQHQLKNRARFWVYANTAVLFKEKINFADIKEQQYDNEGNLQQMSLLVNNKSICLQRITNSVLKGRKNNIVWVYQHTSITAPPFDLSKTKVTQLDEIGQPKLVTLDNNGESILLERISKREQKRRQLPRINLTETIRNLKHARSHDNDGSENKNNETPPKKKIFREENLPKHSLTASINSNTFFNKGFPIKELVTIEDFLSIMWSPLS